MRVIVALLIRSPAPDKVGNMFIDMTGKRFGRLIVLKRAENIGHRSYWGCVCDCGRVKTVSGTNLRSGQVISCGCARIDAVIQSCTTHGLSKSYKHDMWSGAKKRAKGSGVNFSLSIEDIIVPDICPVLGIKIEKGIGKLTHASPTIDRIHPERGYIKGNIRVISHRANLLKSDATTEELEKVLDDSRRFEIFTYA